MALVGEQMGRLYDELKKELGPGMEIPGALAKLYTWIEARGQFDDSPKTGRRCGYLFPPAKHHIGWIKKRRVGGTQIGFTARAREGLDYWFGFRDQQSRKDVSGGRGQKVLERLCTFSVTGGEGSMGALWLGDDGKQRIVNIGSGSGGAMVCVLAEDPVDFLRLLAIGYDEICDGDYFSEPPNARLSGRYPPVEPNHEYHQWVMETFGVTIPRTASEIVPHPAKMNDENSPDLFWQWTRKHSM